jgi:hypothetical protein
MKELETIAPVKLSGEGRALEQNALGAVTNLINMGDWTEGDDGPSKFGAPEPIPTAQEQVPARRQAPPVPVVRKTLPVPSHPSAPLTKKVLPARIFTTGRLRRGKDYILARFGYSVIGFADPLYELQELFFGTRDKQVPGARKFLQIVGQWGRGTLTDEYPLTPARALFVTMIRSMSGSNILPKGVDWAKFGHPDLWVDGLRNRAGSIFGSPRVGVSNVRFENEMQDLIEDGFKHYHVMCSQKTWEKRLAEAKLTPSAPALNDISEQLAIALDKDTLATIKLQPNGPKLNVIWNDDEVAPPSRRLYTLAELE